MSQYHYEGSYSPPEKITIAAIPGDKSLSHRALIVGAISENDSHFDNFLMSEDCLCTLNILKQLGVHATLTKDHLFIKGVGLKGLNASTTPLDVGNSGTSIRLLTGLLSGQPFNSTISGDTSIEKRPMKRVIAPLTLMGAQIEGHSIDGRADIFPPLSITGQETLKPVSYTLPIASAQLKSALLLASLYTPDTSTIREPEKCRDHTERFLKKFGADIQIDGENIHCSGKKPLRNPEPDVSIFIPSDFSSAAFFIVLGCLLPQTTTVIHNVGLNETRAQMIHTLRRMGANISISNEKGSDFEPYGTLTIKGRPLTNIDILTNEIPFIIDEIPILSIAAMFGTGTFRVRQAEELRVKESDRIASIVQMIAAMGGKITEYEDGFELVGGTTPQPFQVDSAGDHRIAMSAIIASIAGNVFGLVTNCGCISTSFPNFFDILTATGIPFRHQD
ncbi:MAG: 3-phosphoshikimate 1-carboxyvinyltransferase [Candidatus Marinamargulisbacteria bacterium]|jgi:3-phosphoshikimate 1-carboxyvinyltransferase